jgi:hypothetical protein
MCCDLNFLVYFLLRIEDRVEVGAVEVGVVAGTWIEVLALGGRVDGITSSSSSLLVLLLVSFSAT